MSAEDELKKALEEVRKKADEMIKEVLDRAEKVAKELSELSQKDSEAAKIARELQAGRIDARSAEERLKKIKRSGES